MRRPGNRRHGHLRRTGSQELEFPGLQQQPAQDRSLHEGAGSEAAPGSVQGESLCPVRLDPFPCDRRAALQTRIFQSKSQHHSPVRKGTAFLTRRNGDDLCRGSEADGNVVKSIERGCSSMVERKLPKLKTRVRFPSPAPSPVLESNHQAAFASTEMVRAPSEPALSSFLTLNGIRHILW